MSAEVTFLQRRSRKMHFNAVGTKKPLIFSVTVSVIRKNITVRVTLQILNLAVLV